MFFYLSFLRNPPVECASTSVDFIIQITNDLRTELYPLSVDVYYSWVSTENGFATNPIKLTTWNPQMAHKLMSIAPPTQFLINGYVWNLVLIPEANIGSSLIHLHRESAIVPVWSASIHLVAIAHKKAKITDKNVKKQDEIRRTFSIPSNISLPNQRDCRFTIIEKTSFELDKKVWDAGIGLSYWIYRLLLSSPQSSHSAVSNLQINSPTVPDVVQILCRLNCNTLELGSGTGLVSIALAAILKEYQYKKLAAIDPSTDSTDRGIHRIHATDLPSAIDLIRRNIELNSHLHGSSQVLLEDTPDILLSAGVLDWEENALPVDVTSSRPDLIIMSDVTYNDASFQPLLRTLRRLCTLSSAARFILAYKERHDSERRIWDMFESEAGILFQKVDEISGAGGAPVEIWLGRSLLGGN